MTSAKKIVFEVACVMTVLAGIYCIVSLNSERSTNTHSDSSASLFKTRFYIPQAVNQTCRDFNCTALGRQPRPDAANITCANTPCVANECCVINNCQDFTCPADKSPVDPRNKVCTGECNTDQCCKSGGGGASSSDSKKTGTIVAIVVCIIVIVIVVIAGAFYFLVVKKKAASDGLDNRLLDDRL
eukprot:NODE_7774_length_743_cov_39.906452_g7160_i0.p1 GENE.NODE_7774_length_743_cov_39.906452_g7160_i0~~NODE_7774_length_743_cov_39.906452_g7160_i0.p1  ORF type:complete len:185 (-),score=29.65 NODE_7774_length_743_cov_39.906452_g7160_i0:123-677(-)